MHLSRIFNERGMAAKQISKTRLSGIQARDLWEINQGVADQLNQRAGTDVTLVVRLHSQNKGEQKIDFLFMEEEAETVIHQKSDNLIAGLDQGINQYVDELSTSLAFLGGADVELDLYVQILGMRSYSEYKRVLNQIAGLEQVLSVRMESATDQSIGYLIRYQSDQALLIESITEITGIQQLSSRVQDEQTAGIIPGSAEMPLYFRYPNPTFTIEPKDGYQQGSLPKVLPRASDKTQLDINEYQG